MYKRQDQETGSFAEADRFLSRTWDEPRHAAVHPNNRWVYMCEEKCNKVLYFDFDQETGRLKALQELSTVPETVTGYSDASEVSVDPTGQWVLVSNRYTDILSVYRIDPLTGYPVSYTHLILTGFIIRTTVSGTMARALPLVASM